MLLLFLFCQVLFELVVLLFFISVCQEFPPSECNDISEEGGPGKDCFGRPRQFKDM